MDGEQNGGTQAQQGAERAVRRADWEPYADAGAYRIVGIDTTAPAFRERDSRIAELEGQVAEAAKSAEAAEGLRAEIAALKEQGESDRIDFALQLAGCRNVKAARAVLDDHGGDIDALKAAEPWMFADEPKKQNGKTGLPNAGAATDADKKLKQWRDIAGLNDEE